MDTLAAGSGPPGPPATTDRIPPRGPAVAAPVVAAPAVARPAVTRTAGSNPPASRTRVKRLCVIAPDPARDRESPTRVTLRLAVPYRWIINGTDHRGSGSG